MKKPEIKQFPGHTNPPPPPAPLLERITRKGRKPITPHIIGSDSYSFHIKRVSRMRELLRNRDVNGYIEFIKSEIIREDALIKDFARNYVSATTSHAFNPFKMILNLFK